MLYYLMVGGWFGGVRSELIVTYLVIRILFQEKKDKFAGVIYKYV